VGPRGLIWRGQVYDVDLGQPIGHEPAFLRPAIVVSVDAVNDGPGGLVAVVPITSTAYGLRSHVEIEPGLSGLDHSSYARCDQLRVVSIKRFVTHRGLVASAAMLEIEQALRFILGL
jgi:mRNA interferase MazF